TANDPVSRFVARDWNVTFPKFGLKFDGAMNVKLPFGLRLSDPTGKGGAPAAVYLAPTSRVDDRMAPASWSSKSLTRTPLLTGTVSTPPAGTEYVSGLATTTGLIRSSRASTRGVNRAAGRAGEGSLRRG